MKLEEITFSGFLTFDYSDDFKTIKLIDGENQIDLVKKFRGIFDLFECEVSCSYFLSNEKKSENEILEGWITDLCGGITAENKTDSYHYSSYTFGTDYDTYLSIGGHDLFNEFDSHYGKWCVLKITLKHNDK